MGLSNADGHLVLARGNKSELAVGYSTIYGDAVGGYAPLKDVPKTLVWRLAKWRNADAEARGQNPPIPENAISKPPSRRAAPGPGGHRLAAAYALLDDMLDDYVERDRGSAELVAAGFEPDLVGKVIQHGRPRRVQAAAVPAGAEDHAEGVRPRPAPADHQRVARGCQEGD